MLLETLYEPLPDVDLYLERIHMKGPVRRERDVLDEIIYRHQCRIPFENLDVYFGRQEIRMGVSEVFDKIIRRKRGGFCFEMNNLFHAFLEELGFDVYPCLCKVIEGEGPHYPALHRGTIAKFDGELYYCDVGFGGPVPAGAIKLEENTIQKFAGDSFLMRLRMDGWWELVRFGESGKEQVMLRVNPMPYDQVDFVALCHYCCCHTQQDFNHFTDEILLNIRTENGYASITNQVFKQKENGVVNDMLIKDSQQLLKIMYEVFLLPEEIETMVKAGR